MAPYCQHAVLASAHQRGPLIAQRDAPDGIIVGALHLCDLPLLEDVPDLHRVVVIRGEEEAARIREHQRLDTLEARLLFVLAELTDGTQVIELDGRVVAADGQGVHTKGQ